MPVALIPMARNGRSFFKASRGLELNLELAYLHAQFDDFVNPTGAATTDFNGFRSAVCAAMERQHRHNLLVFLRSPG